MVHQYVLKEFVVVAETAVEDGAVAGGLADDEENVVAAEQRQFHGLFQQSLLPLAVRDLPQLLVVYQVDLDLLPSH